MGIHTGAYFNSPTLGAASLLSGDGDSSAVFGSSQAIIVSSFSTWSPGSAVSVSTWIDILTPQAFAYLFNGDQLGSIGNVFLRSGAGGVIEFFIRIGGGFFQTPAYPAPGPGVHNYVGVYSGTDIRLYVDGALYGSPTAKTGAVDAASSDLLIGNKSGGGSFGTDDVAVWSRAITAAEVTSLYRIGIGA